MRRVTPALLICCAIASAMSATLTLATPGVRWLGLVNVVVTAVLLLLAAGLSLKEELTDHARPGSVTYRARTVYDPEAETGYVGRRRLPHLEKLHRIEPKP
jgi:hypothetical protein